jgi:hypothetical protein
LPSVCRHPALFADIISRLIDGGYNKWEVANYWALEALPIEKLDISFDTSIYMLNTQAISMAQKIGASQVNLSLEDIKTNVCNIIEKSPIKTELVIYQDTPLFISVGCIRNNDCKICKQGEKWFELEKDGQKFEALSRDCQIMLFDNRPYCIATEAKDLEPDCFRIDFAYRKYKAEKVLNIFNQLVEFKGVSNCIKGNFNNKNI